VIYKFFISGYELEQGKKHHRFVYEARSSSTGIGFGALI
jgi:hypothetical protein